MKGYKQLAIGGIVILAVVLISGTIGYTVGKGSAKGWHPGKRQIAKMMRTDFPAGLSRAEKIEKLKKIYRKDPQEFRETLEHRGQMLRERLARLKEEDPAKYREVLQKQIERLETTLAKLKSELPEAAKE